MESPNTTGDTDEDSLSSTSEHQLIDRNHLLSLATNVSLPDSQSERVSSDSNGFEHDDEENSNEEEDNQEHDHVLQNDTTGNPPTLPDPGDRIEFFNPDLQEPVEAIVIKMDRKTQSEWPGWRNIVDETSGIESSVNLDAFATNCVAWRFSQEPDIEVARDIPISAEVHSLHPTPNISIDEYEEDGFDTMQLISLEDDVAPETLTTSELVCEETEDDDQENVQIDEAFNFLDSAFSVSHQNLGIPRNMQIEANRVYDLTEALDIEIPINSNTYVLAKRPEYHLLQRQNPLTDPEQHATKKFNLLPKFVRRMKLFRLNK